MQHVLTHVSCWSQVCQSLTRTFIHSAIDACPNHLQCVSMKRTLEVVYNSMERSRKIFAPEHYWHGCPYCSAAGLSWNEWCSFATVFQNEDSDNQYHCCQPCLSNIMHKHWDLLRWWRWNGEGDSQEQFATSPFHSHQFL